MEKTAGVIVIEERLGAFTVSAAVPDTDPIVAVITTVPAFSAVNTPLPLTVATEVFEHCHVTCEVRFCVLLSE